MLGRRVDVMAAVNADVNADVNPGISLVGILWPTIIDGFPRRYFIASLQVGYCTAPFFCFQRLLHPRQFGICIGIITGHD